MLAIVVVLILHYESPIQTSVVIYMQPTDYMNHCSQMMWKFTFYVGSQVV